MTISLIPADDRFRRFVCTGGETVFPVTFPFFAATDLQVVRLRGGVETTLALTSDYTVAGAGNPSGGSVTLLTPAVAGDVIAIRGEQPVARTSEWTDGQALTARALNAEHARHTILHQQLLREVSRGVRLSLTEPAATLLLPAQTERANRVLGFNAAGQPVAVVPNVGNLVVTPWAQTLLDDTTAAQARATIDFETAGDARWGRLTAANVWTQPQRVGQELYVDRADFSNEGGRLILRRASDNADAYQIQPHGSGSSPVLRVVRLFGTPAEIANFDQDGRLTIAAPTAAQHAATKGYADGLDTAARAYTDAQIAALNAVRVVATATVSSPVSQVDLTLPAGFAMFMLVVGDVIGSVASELRLRTSADGVNFASGGSDYELNSGGVASSLRLATLPTGPAGLVGQFVIYPGAATTPRFAITGQTASDGGSRAAAGRQQAIRMFAASGTINRGTFRLIGMV